MKISELSKKTGISQRMLRYFEQEQLLEPARSEADYREYKPKDEQRVLEIREWQRLGLTLREIKRLLSDPSCIDQILEPVLDREREALVQKEKSLRDLRERLLGRKTPHFAFRVAHPIPKLDEVLAEMQNFGWSKNDFSYSLFCSWRDEANVATAMFGEIISRSAFYLLTADDEIETSILQKLMMDFDQTASTQWVGFDSTTPQRIESADIGDFFGPHDIVACLKFNSDKTKNLTIVLPYQALYGFCVALNTASCEAKAR